MYKKGYINGFALGYGISADAISDSDYHCNDDYEIMYVRKGSRKVFVKNRAYHITAGNLLFIDKNIIHKSQRLSDEYERFVINFTDDYIMPSVKKQIPILFQQRIYAPTKLSITDKLFFSIFSEWEQLRKNNDIAQDTIKCYVNILLTHFIRNNAAYAYDNAKYDNPTIERLVQYMNKNLKSQITLGSSAKMLHLSPSHLSRIFLKHTGFGFLEYLKILRIETGKHLLINTNMTVKQIAFECGFNDSNYFSSVFKTETGMSPLKYRKAN